MRRLRLIYPAVSFAEAPFTLPFGLVFEIIEDTSSVLNIVLPLSYKAITTGPNLGASSFHLSSFEFAIVNRLVRPRHFSFSFHIIVLELALIKTACISKVVLAESVELSVYEVSFVVSTFELESTLACLLAFYKLTGKLNLIIVPRLSSVAMLLIILPHSFVHRTICVDEYAHAICFSIYPFSLVDVAVGVRHTTFAIELLFLRHTLIS